MNNGEKNNSHRTMVLLKSSEEVVAFSYIIVFVDYRNIVDPGGRISCGSIDLHIILITLDAVCWDGIREKK